MTYFADYVFKNGRTLLVDGKGNETDFCTAVKITEVFTSVEDGTKTIKICIDGFDSFVVNREVLVNDILGCLTKHGLSVARVREYEVTISEILFDTEIYAKKYYCHKSLGFYKYKGKLRFLAKDSIIDNCKSKYIGTRNLKSNGTFETWQDGIVGIVKKSPATLIALAMGASAPVAYLLSKANAITESPIYSIVGRSSVGKTTMLKLAASAWGKPSLDGVIDTLSGSEVGFFASLSNKTGFPHFVDETSATKIEDFTDVIYEVSQCQEGNKCMGDGSLRQARKWFSSVIFTGEKSLLTQTNKNSGLYARVAEFDISWFEGEEWAVAINKHVSQNYGTAYTCLIDKLKKYKKEDLVKDFEKCYEELLKKIDDDSCSSIGRRLLKKYTILLLSVDIITKAWNLAIDRKCVLKILAESFQNCLPDTDTYRRFYEDFLMYISSNMSLFPKKAKHNEMFPGSRLGIQDTYKYRPCVWINCKTFESILEKSGLGCSNGILRELHNNRILEYFNDRFRKKKTIGTIKPLCFCVYLDAY